MLPFYFLSVLCNAITGFVLVYSEQKKDNETSLPLVNDKNFRLILGIVTFLTGFIKLFTPVDSILILGDLLPVIAGFAGGAALLLEYFNSNSTTGIPLSPLLSTIFITHSKYIGIFCILISFEHFLFSKIIFL